MRKNLFKSIVNKINFKRRIKMKKQIQMAIIGCLILFASGAIQASDLIELRDDFWGGKQYRIGGNSNWESIGLFGENLKSVIDKAPENISDKYGMVSLWRPVYMVSSSISGFIIGWNIVNPTLDWNIAWAGLGVAVVSFILSENGINDTVSAYNELYGTQAGLQLNFEQESIKFCWNINY
jgi:hypothetical protein